MGSGSTGAVAGLTGGASNVWSKISGKEEGTNDPFGLFGHRPDPAEAAARAEAERQAGIKDTIGKINSVYDAPGRQKQYSDFISAVRDKYLQDATRQKGVADLQNKFALARSGLNGGSRAVDSKRLLGEEFQQGVLQSENKAQGALGQLKSADNQSRLNLIQLAQGGLDATTAAGRALANTQSGIESARADATSQGLGDIFAGSAAAIKKQQDAAALRQGRTAPIGSLYGKPGFGG